jgi:hypothetical protein
LPACAQKHISVALTAENGGMNDPGINPRTIGTGHGHMITITHPQKTLMVRNDAGYAIGIDIMHHRQRPSLARYPEEEGLLVEL